MTPSEALDIAISYPIVSSRRISKVPGSVIALLSEEVREALRELKSEDTIVRVDWMKKNVL